MSESLVFVELAPGVWVRPGSIVVLEDLGKGRSWVTVRGRRDSFEVPGSPELVLKKIRDAVYRSEGLVPDE